MSDPTTYRIMGIDPGTNYSLDAGGNLGRAAGLGAVADDTGHDGQRVDEVVGDSFQIRPL